MTPPGNQTLVSGLTSLMCSHETCSCLKQGRTEEPSAWGRECSPPRTLETSLSSS
jgi:hypothetical protein